MPEQLALAWCPPPPPRPLSIEERWAAFHAEHPEVYVLFERFALRAVEQGAERVGSKAIWERMRWEVQVEGGEDGFKLNNVFTPYYAREFLRRHPGLDGLFELRRVKGEVA